MARIQKKKTASKTKNQKSVAAGPESNGDRPDSGRAESGKQDAASQIAAPAGEKKKKAYTVNKPSGTGQSATMQLAEKYFGNWMQFFREVKVELTKVTWPTKKQTIGSTAVVIVFVFVVAIFLGLVDIGLSNLIRLIL